ncbi:M3 family oligoendopeptidase [Calidithermus chliarophilus]|uniref:M3 family oligoendopeptidase n=1 Tax=Calidithermus chliarophilus TaxID=52023 RepID=UPI000414B7B5|nr:M3 family oligoendopeptidase [Calidithermus chliarophilus]
MSVTAQLPRWNLEPLFKGLQSPDFLDAYARLEQQITELEALFERHEVRARPMREGDAAAFAAVIEQLNAISLSQNRINTYLYALVSTNSGDEEAQARYSLFRNLSLRLQKLRSPLTTWLASLDPEAVNAGEYRILLEEARVQAEHLMSEAEEVLAAELSLSGGGAFARLHSNVSSQITVKVRGEELPISSVRLLAFDPDEATRKAAYEAELEAWKAHRIPLAAALNGWKGQQSTLNRKRGWADDLEPTLFTNRITRKALGAMQEVMEASFPHWRRYFRAKAKALGKAGLDWWDLFAPVGHSHSRWSWEAGRDFIIEHLASFSPADAEVARRMYAEGRIDAEPRKGKQVGAYCSHFGGGESLIFTNYEESFGGVSTMAHELGHAYHNYCMRSKPPLLARGPMTLAETASIMNETIITEAALRKASEAEQVTLLEGNLQDAAQVIVDIHSRFLFERSVFERRKERELSASEFCALMLEAQQATYGDGLASYHPYMWAVKGHYYGIDFYNYPYAFGLLFGLALYNKHLELGPDFLPQYEDLLASVGVYPAKELAARFGFDLEDPAFWQGGMDVLMERIGRFERLVG